MTPSKSSIKNLTAVDSAALDCGVCECPLKPPIFQCEVGHLVCSECKEKMAAAETCHVCRRTLAGGYKRCYGAEHIVECLRVRCPNKANGCFVKLARYDQSAHLQACQYRPYHCPAEDCTFAAGQLPALRDHFENKHKWPSTTVYCIVPNSGTANLALVDGFNLIVLLGDTEIDPSGLVLLKVTRESYGRAVTAIDIRPRNSDSEKCRLRFEYKAPCRTHRWEHEFNWSFLDCCFDFVVPKSARPLDMDTMELEFHCLQWNAIPDNVES